MSLKVKVIWLPKTIGLKYFTTIRIRFSFKVKKIIDNFFNNRNQLIQINYKVKNYYLPSGVLGFWGFGVLGLGFRV